MNHNNPWLLELRKFFPTADIRKWNSFIGVSFATMNYIERATNYNFKKYDLLLFFSWLKIYGSFDAMALIWRSSRSTVERKCKNVLDSLWKSLGEISLNKIKKLGGKLKGNYLVVGSIDSFECNLQKPIDFEKANEIFSGKKKQCTYKYQILISIIDGTILHQVDVIPCNSKPCVY